MRAAVIKGPNDLRLEDLPVPVAGPGEVVMRITGVGVCGSDAWMFRTGRPGRELGPPPLVPGHEFAGARCREGRTNLCTEYKTYGGYYQGGLAEFVAVPEQICVPVEPHGVSGDDAALAQPMAIAHHGVSRGRVAEDDRLLLMGAGGVGAFVIWAASQRGAHVTVVDTDPDRLAQAADLGAGATVLGSKGEGLGPRLAGLGPWNVGIETTGVRAPLEALLTELDRGGRLVLLGMHHEPRALDLAAVTHGELDLLGTQAHVCAVDIPAALDLLARRPAGWADVAPRVFPLDDLVEQAILPLAEGRSRRIKSIFDPSATAPRPYSREDSTGGEPVDIPA
jgi:(R,R)-butanediol dehydrogenase/meso-butanediol dehydrogenase/diacetyl reductase